VSNYLICLDPGLRSCGVAIFKDSVLWKTLLPRSPDMHTRGPGAWKLMAEQFDEAIKEAIQGETFDESDFFHFVSEVPQVYLARKIAVDPDDLIQLAGVVGACLASVPGDAVGYYPREWKKQMPKDIHHRRIRKRLAAGELAILEATHCPPSLIHNVIDAVGIGLFHLARHTKEEIDSDLTKLAESGRIEET
jgi:hypothetical protein